NSLQLEKEKNSGLTRYVSYLSGHAETLEKEQAAEYKNFTDARNTKDTLEKLRNGDPSDETSPSLAKAKDLVEQGDIESATQLISTLSEQLNIAGVKVDYSTQIESLKTIKEDYAKIDQRLQTAETTT